MHLAPIGDLADVEPVPEEIGERSHAEADAAALLAIATGTGLGRRRPSPRNRTCAPRVAYRGEEPGLTVNRLRTEIDIIYTRLVQEATGTKPSAPGRGQS
jgi:hypothetical protein